MCVRLFPLFIYFLSSFCALLRRSFAQRSRSILAEIFIYLLLRVFSRFFVPVYSRDFAAAAAVATTFGFGGSFSTLYAVCAYLFRLFFSCSSRGSVAFTLRFVELNEKKSLALFVAVRELPVASTTLDARQSSC